MDTIEVTVLVIVVAVVGFCIWIERQSRLAEGTVEQRESEGELTRIGPGVKGPTKVPVSKELMTSGSHGRFPLSPALRIPVLLAVIGSPYNDDLQKRRLSAFLAKAPVA
jgi:hypothetical protein